MKPINLGFHENIGQYNFIDDSESILYGARIGKTNVYFKTDAIIFSVEEHEDGVGDKPKVTLKEYELQLKNTNQDTWVYGLDKKDFDRIFVNLQNHREFRTIPFTYLYYKNIYEGIDLKFCLPEQGGLKYEFILHPGSDPSDIVIAHEDGCKILSDLKTESISIATSIGHFTDLFPTAHYENSSQAILIDYAIDTTAAEVGFNIDNYDESRTVIIDPWINIQTTTNPSTYFDYIDYDYFGNTYATLVDNFLPNFTNPDLYKYDSNGNLLWALTPNNGTSNFWSGLSVDRSTGNSYLAMALGPIAIDTSGSLLYIASPFSYGDPQEHWQLEYNQCSDRLICGMGDTQVSLQYGDIGNTLSGGNALMEPIYGGQVTTDCMKLTLSPDQNFMYGFIGASATIDTTILFKVDVSGATPSFNVLWTSNDGRVLISEADPTPSVIAAGSNFLYTYAVSATNSSEQKLYKRDNLTGLLLDSLTFLSSVVPIGTFYNAIDVDICDNVYIGKSGMVSVYDENLTLISNIPISNPAEDVRYIRVTEDGRLLISTTEIVSTLFGDTIHSTLEQIDLVNFGINLNNFQVSATPTLCDPCTGTATINLDTNTICAASNDLSVLWSPSGDTTLTALGLCFGWHTVEVSSVCNSLLFIDSVFVDSVCGLNIDVIDDTICIGDCFDIVATTTGNTGGVSYQWDNGIPDTDSIVNVCPTLTTTYQVIVNDSIGNSDTANVTIFVLPIPVVNLGNDTSFCNFYSVLNAGNTGASFLWQDGSIGQTFTTDTSGTYFVEVNNGGCTVTDSINLTFNTLIVNLGNDTTFCEGDSVLLDAQNSGSVFLWNNGSTSQTLTVDSSGTYKVTVDNGLCVVSDSIDITVFSQDAISLGDDMLICGGWLFAINAPLISGADYLWHDGTDEQFNFVSGAGTYWVEVSTDLCTFADTIEFYDSNTYANLGSDTSICNPNFVLDAGSISSATYLWQDGSTNQTFNVTAAGTYYVTVTDTLFNCQVTDTIVVSEGGINVNLGNDTTVCNPNFVLNPGATSGATYLWQDGSTNQTYTLTDTGVYYVTVTDTLNNCQVSDTIMVSQGNLSVDLGSDTMICLSDSLLLNAQNPGATYNWSTGSTNQTIMVSSQGVYSVVVTEGICNSIDSIQIDFHNESEPEFTVNDTVGCKPNYVSFTDLSTPVSDIVFWHWNFGDGKTSNAQNPSHEYVNSGDYLVSLEVTNNVGCATEVSRTVQVILYENPEANFMFSPQNPQVDQEVQFTDHSINAQSWYWTFGDGSTSMSNNPNHVYKIPQTFSVYLVVNNEECVDTAFATVIIEEELIFYVPNAFTPDGDLFNNTFQPVFTSGFDPYNFHMVIYNRWGEIVFESYNAEKGWTATYNGQKVQSGSYVWQIQFGDLNNDKTHSYIGHVIVLN